MRLSVLQVNTADRGGGAEAVALGLHRALGARGVDASLVVGYRRTNEPGVLLIGQTPCNSLLQGRLRRVLADPGVALDVIRGREDFRFPATQRVFELVSRMPDIAHLHNLHGGYFDLRALPELTSRVTTVVTLHDEWLFTGHCAYTLGCDRWLTTCGRCPHLDVYPRLLVDGTAGNRRRKADLYERSRLHVAAPSRWLLERAQRSILAPAIASARVIPNGVDLTVFSPGDRAHARARLALPQEAHVLVFAAQGARTNPYKDFGTLRAALTRLRVPAIAFALGEQAPVERLGSVELRSQPFLEPAQVADYLRASDVYVLPTRADNHPLTSLEALASGTPVVASRVGGLPEQLTAETGVLVEPGDPVGLARALEELLHDPERRARMGAAAVGDARASFSIDRQADAYVDLYREVVQAS